MKYNLPIWGALLCALALASARVLPEPEDNLQDDVKVSGPIHCIVGPWKESTECSHSCGSGVLTQSRDIFQEPRYGGQPCPALTQIVECNLKPCPPCKQAGCVGTFRNIDGSDTTAPKGTAFLRDPQRSRPPSKLTTVGRPSPRDISNVVFNSQQRWLLPRSMRVNTLLYYFGRFLHNDMVSFAMEKDVECRKQGESAPIPVPAGDPWFDPKHTGNEHINFTRTSHCIASDGSREYRNGVTGAIDASNIYGSDPEVTNTLRTMEGGKLKMDKEVPPLDPTTKHCLNGQCWKLGDSRDNENAVVAAIHTIFMLEHNRVATLTARDHPDWTDEQIFQEARKWVIGRIQAIVYTEYLPALLGESCPSLSEPLTAKASGISSQVSLEFASMADLFHYSGLPDEVLLMHPENSSTAAVFPVADTMLAPAILNKTSLPQVLLGTSRQQARTLDAVISDSLRNKKFNSDLAGALEEESDGHYMDLVSEIIQRGRDHGMASYNDMRASLGLPAVTSFQQISDRQGLARRLEAMYGHIDKLDAFVGGMAESPSHGSLLGTTFSKVLCEQFSRTRAADPYFYERYNEFTDKQKRSLTRQTTFTDIIALNIPKLANRKLDSNAFGFHSHDTQHCSVTEWKNDGVCTRPCGSGRQIQRRNILKEPASGGIRCPPLKRVIECNAQPCSGDLTLQRTHCQVTEWRSWGSCSVKCGGGTQKQYRKVTTHPSNGGQVCPPLFRIVGCNQEDCATESGETQQQTGENQAKKGQESTQAEVEDEDEDEVFKDLSKLVQMVPCEVSEWSALGPCSITCGGKGTRKQYRSILQVPTERNSKCPPTARDVPCYTDPCPGDVIAAPSDSKNTDEAPTAASSPSEWQCIDPPSIAGKVIKECANKPHGASCVVAGTNGKPCFTTCKRAQWSKLTCGRAVPETNLEPDTGNAGDDYRDSDAYDEDGNEDTDNNEDGNEVTDETSTKSSKLAHAKERAKENAKMANQKPKVNKPSKHKKTHTETSENEIEDRSFGYGFLLVVLAMVGTLVIGSVVIYHRRTQRRTEENEGLIDGLPKFHGYSKGKGASLLHPKILRKTSGLITLPTLSEEPPTDITRRTGYNRRASENWFQL